MNHWTKKLIFLVMTILLLTGCQDNKELKHYDREELESRATEVLDLVHDKDKDKILALSTDTLKEALTEEVFQKIFEDLDGAGAFKEIKTIQTTEIEQSGVYYGVTACQVEYQEKTLIYTITFDEELNLAGIYYK